MQASKFVTGQTPDSPGVGAVTPTLSNTVNELRPFKALEVFAAGTVVFVAMNGEEVTWPEIQEAWLPYTIRVGVLRVKVTGTTVAAADMRGIL